MERINHHGQFMGFFFADASFNGSGMWTVGNASRMQGDLSFFNVISAHKITIHIIQQLIAVDVAMVIRRRNGIGMIIINRGTKLQITKFLP